MLEKTATYPALCHNHIWKIQARICYLILLYLLSTFGCLGRSSFGWDTEYLLHCLLHSEPSERRLAFEVTLRDGGKPAPFPGHYKACRAQGGPHLALKAVMDIAASAHQHVEGTQCSAQAWVSEECHYCAREGGQTPSPPISSPALQL